MTTIYVNKIKNNQGGNSVQINALKGIDTAGSITVQSEGTPSLVLQQVIAKIWRKFQNDASSYDSFGISSGTDNGTGNYTHTFSIPNYHSKFD